MKRTPRVDGEVADALRALAALLDTGITMRAALIALPAHTAGLLAPVTAQAARRARLGLPIGRITEEMWRRLGPQYEVLSCLFASNISLGGDITALLDEMALLLDRMISNEAAIRDASAAARLSGRLVTGAPLLFVPFMPLAGAVPHDVVGAVTWIVGIFLAVVGTAWIRKLAPRPPPTLDPLVVIVMVLASALRAGVALPAALGALSLWGPTELRPALARTARLRCLSFGTRDALRLSGNLDLCRLSGCIEHGAGAGLPLAASLELFAQHHLDEQTRAFTIAVKRAPILMVVPLVACFLPAFILIGVVPFARVAFG